MFIKDMTKGMGHPIQTKKRYARVKKGEFVGFYLDDHPDFNLESGEFLDIGEEKIKQLIVDSSVGKGRIIYLKTGEIGLYQLPVNTKKMVSAVFNFEMDKWEETATLKEQVDYWYSEIQRLSREIAIANIDTMINSIPLQEKLEQAKQKHTELSHELALQIDQNIK